MDKNEEIDGHVKDAMRYLIDSDMDFKSTTTLPSKPRWNDDDILKDSIKLLKKIVKARENFFEDLFKRNGFSLEDGDVLVMPHCEEMPYNIIPIKYKDQIVITEHISGSPKFYFIKNSYLKSKYGIDKLWTKS